jgi:threonine dehydrogenase-like Zn-dependent dehydrogenase
MASMTKAAVLFGPRAMETRELPIPDVKEDTALLRVEVTGVCGVDWPAYTGVRKDRFKPPIILGHEIVGRIEKMGRAAAEKWGLREGDRVALEEYAPCGHCPFCLSGHYYLCGGIAMKRMYGFTCMEVDPGLWGGFSEYVYLDPNSRIHRLADEVPSRIAPLYIPISNGIRWVQSEAGIGIGDTLAILGPGQLGLACVIAAKEAGARRIIETGRTSDAKRLALAREFGATDVINVDEVDVVERVAEITGGEMVDAVINVTSNAPAAPQQALRLAKMRGTIVLAGGANGAAVGFEADLISRKELTLKGVRGRTERDLKKAIRLLESGKYPLEKFSTHKFSIETAEEALLTIGGEGAPDAVHVSVFPN